MPKTTLITGANRGIGLTLARLAAERGDRVLAAARRPGAALALNDLARTNSNISVLNTDVTDPHEMAATATSEDTSGGILSRVRNVLLPPAGGGATVFPARSGTAAIVHLLAIRG